MIVGDIMFSNFIISIVLFISNLLFCHKLCFWYANWECGLILNNYFLRPFQQSQKWPIWSKTKPFSKHLEYDRTLTSKVWIGSVEIHFLALSHNCGVYLSPRKFLEPFPFSYLNLGNKFKTMVTTSVLFGLIPLGTISFPSSQGWHFVVLPKSWLKTQYKVVTFSHT